MPHSISQKIVRNTFYNALGRGWAVLTSLILTPYIISHLGVERYGILALLGGVTGYFGLFDFGISTSFVKYIAEFYAKKDLDKINAVVNTGATFYCALGVAVFLLSLFLMDPILGFLKIPGQLREEAAMVFVMGVGIFSISSVFGSFSSVLGGLQRMDVSNFIGLLVSVPSIAGTVFVIESGYGLPGLMVNTLVITLIGNALNIGVAFRMLPELRFDLLLFNKELFKKLFSFGYKMQVSRLANLISFETDKILITKFLSIGLVTYYQLGVSILSQARQIPLLLISALIPAVSELEARGGKEALVKLFMRGSKYLISLSTPLLVFVVTNATIILLAWMGPGYGKTVAVINILSLGYYFATVTGVASSIAAGVARTDLDMRFGVTLAILNLGLSVGLIIQFGFYGVLAGTGIALTLSSAYYVKLFHSYLKLPAKHYIGLFTKPAIACLLPGILTGGLNALFYTEIVAAGRLFYLCLVGLNGVVFFTLYSITILNSRYFDDYDRDFMGAKVPVLRYIFSKYAY